MHSFVEDHNAKKHAHTFFLQYVLLLKSIGPKTNHLTPKVNSCTVLKNALHHVALMQMGTIETKVISMVVHCSAIAQSAYNRMMTSSQPRQTLTRAQTAFSL